MCAGFRYRLRDFKISGSTKSLIHGQHCANFYLRILLLFVLYALEKARRRTLTREVIA